MSETFMQACLDGGATLDDVDDWVDAWHESDGDESLDAYLGFTPDEGALWAEKPWTLRYLVMARKFNKPYVDLLKDQQRHEFALAARSGSQRDATKALAWLRERGRI